MTPQPGSTAGGNPAPERESDAVSVDTDATTKDAVTAAEAAPQKKPVKRTTRRRSPASGSVAGATVEPAVESSDDAQDVQGTEVVEAAPQKKPVKRTTRRRSPAGGSVAGAAVEPAVESSDDAQDMQGTEVVEAAPQKKPAERTTRRRSPVGTQVVEAAPEKNPEDNAAEGQDTEDIGEYAADTESASASCDESEGDQDDAAGGSTNAKRAFSFSRLFAFGVLPALVLLLAGAAGYLKWQSVSIRASQISGVESTAAAKDGTVAMLSYQPDTVDKDLGGARDRLTGTFKDSYTQLTHDVVIPGAKQKHISAVATVPAAASVSATADHAVALVFVNQTVVVGSDPPSATASVVRVTLDKVGDRWLISAFDPV
jgi:Mce-associated membrane protein